MLVLVLATSARATAGEQEAGSERSRYDASRRFYFYFEPGFDFLLHRHVINDTEMHDPRGPLPFLGGGGGYNLNDHWGIELQMHATYPDLVSDSQGKVGQYGNITLIPAVKYRWPLEEGRFVPYLTGGIGGSLNELSDNGNTFVKNHLSERATIVGSIFAGFDYFVNPDVAVGLSFGSFIYPDQGYSQVIRDDKNRITFQGSTSAANQSRLGLLGHVTLYPGQADDPDNPGLRRLLLADHGPFDTVATRFYLYAVGGSTFDFNDSFGGGVKIKAPGDFNATYGGGLGFNWDGHWGAELQLSRRESNVTLPAIGKFEQLSIFDVIPMVRFRYPLCRGRFVPFAMAGVGFAYYRLNDRQNFGSIKSSSGNSAIAVHTPQLNIQLGSVVSQLSLGAEYFLNRNVSFGVSVPFYIYPDVSTGVDGGPYNTHVRDSANFTGVALLIQIHAYLS